MKGLKVRDIRTFHAVEKVRRRIAGDEIPLFEKNFVCEHSPSSVTDPWRRNRWIADAIPRRGSDNVTEIIRRRGGPLARNNARKRNGEINAR